MGTNHSRYGWSKLPVTNYAAQELKNMNELKQATIFICCNSISPSILQNQRNELEQMLSHINTYASDAYYFNGSVIDKEQQNHELYNDELQYNDIHCIGFICDSNVHDLVSNFASRLEKDPNTDLFIYDFVDLAMDIDQSSDFIINLDNNKIFFDHSKLIQYMTK
jgi:hypothetical protein